MKISLPFVAGLILSAPIFFEIGSNIFLAQSSVAQGGVTLPLSILLAPLLGIKVFINWNLVGSAATKICTVFLIIFLGWSLILALLFSERPIVSLLYTCQWVYPFLWLFYFDTLKSAREETLLIRGIFSGALIGATLYSFSGIAEIITRGALLYGGRMTQNLILPGQYQIYVYTPTALAYWALICLAFYHFRIIKVRLISIMSVLAFSALAVAFTGAREAALVFILGALGIFFIKSRRGLVIGGLLIVSSGLLVSSFSEYFLNIVSQSEFGLLRKLGNLFDEGGRFSSRDIIARLYWDAIQDDPLRGSAMLPPESGLLALRGMEIPSAHNLYIDAFAWGGGLHFLSYVGLAIYVTFKCARNLIEGIASRHRIQKSISYLSFLLILYLVISNNINVPMRQPLTGPIGMFLIYWVFKKNPSVGK